MPFDFTLTDRQKKAAVAAGVLALLLMVLGAYLVTRPRNYDEERARLNQILATGRAPTTEDLRAIAPLLGHPDRQVAAQANQFFLSAEPAAINEVANSLPESLDEASKRRVYNEQAAKDPAEAVRRQKQRLSADRDTRMDVYNVIGAAAVAESVEPLLAGLDDPDETIRSSILSMISSNPRLAKLSSSMAGKLAKLAADPKSGPRVATHAARALAAVNGDTAGATAPYPPSPLAQGKGG